MSGSCSLHTCHRIRRTERRLNENEKQLVLFSFVAHHFKMRKNTLIMFSSGNLQAGYKLWVLSLPWPEWSYGLFHAGGGGGAQPNFGCVIHNYMGVLSTTNLTKKR